VTTGRPLRFDAGLSRIFVDRRPRMRYSKSRPLAGSDKALCAAYAADFRGPGRLPARGRPGRFFWARESPGIWGQLASGNRETLGSKVDDRRDSRQRIPEAPCKSGRGLNPKQAARRPRRLRRHTALGTVISLAPARGMTRLSALAPASRSRNRNRRAEGAARSAIPPQVAPQGQRS
jgi:hypothetical protein